jgi:hypothetical protein
MRKLKIGFLFTACVLVFSIQTQGSETQNPGFENGLKNWTSFIYGSAVPSGYVTIDNSDYETGTASARINFPVGYEANDFGGIQQSTAVTAGTTYLASVAIKFQNAASCHMKVVWRNGSSEIQTDWLMYGEEGSGTSDGWQTRNVALSAPANATTATLMILERSAQDPSQPGYVWIDNAGIVPLSGNQFKNIGFEDGLQHWNFVYGACPPDRVKIDRTEYQSGTASAVIVFPEGYEPADFNGIQQVVNVEGDKQYNVSACVKFQNTAASHIKVVWYNNSTPIKWDYLMYGGEGSGSSAGWLVKNATLTAPTNANYAIMTILAYSASDNSQPGYLWVDNAGFTNTEAPVFNPAGPEMSSSSSPVTITSATPGATIYYTLDGSTPTSSSLNGRTPVNLMITSGTTLTAMATADGCLNSSVTSQKFIKFVDYQVTAISPMVKLRKDQIPNSQVTSYSLHAARGEGESGQLVISSTETLTKVTCEAQPLTGPNGITITPELKLVAYVHRTTGFDVTGDYPDPLKPMKSFDVTGGTSQSVFFNVWVPTDAPVGEYTGAITVTAENGIAKTISLTLRVYNVALPTQPLLKTDMQIWNFLPNWYGDNYTGPMLDRTRLLCLKYRCTSPEWMDLRYFITKNTDGTFTANWTSFDQTAQYWFDQGATVFHLQDLFVSQQYNLPATSQEEADMGTRLAMTQTHLEEKGWLDRCYFYIFDEPNLLQISQVKTQCSLIHQYAPKLHILLTYCSNLGTNAPTTLIGYTNPWVPKMDYYNASFLSARQAAGDEVWCYSCSYPDTPYPNGIGQAGVVGRAVGMWCWQYKCQGYLYWCMDYWTSDPWTDNSKGDGYLLWPDPNKVDDPYPSIRLACARDGFEDYDLLSMLKTRINAIKANSILYQQNKTLVDGAESLLNTSAIVSSISTFSKEPSVYEEHHQTVLEKLGTLMSLVVKTPGDANGDGKVNVTDLSVLAAYYNTTSGATWAMGDFDCDHDVDVTDLSMLAANYNSGSTSTLSWAEAYAQAFGTTSDDANETNDASADDSEDTTSSVCSSLGLSLIAGLAMMGLLLVKLEE